MASDWNEELDKYESGRSFGDDLRDSVRTACLIVSKNAHIGSERNTCSKDNGWINGSQGWGNYVNGEKMEYDIDD